MSFLGQAQISITMADMPSANDTIRYSIVQSSTGMNYKATGANMTWDFTKLKSNSQGLYEYKNSSATPYIFNFGTGAIGVKIADSLGSGQISFKQLYNFYKKSSTKWEAVGLGFQLGAIPLPQAGKHTNTDEIYQFPLNFQDRDSATFALKIPITVVILNVGNYYQNGNRINTVDGWGKISTPYQSNIECIRVKSVITETDSLAIAITGQTPINFAFPNNRIEYKWLSKTEKIPVLEVSGTEIGGTFTPTTVRYRDNFVAGSNVVAPVATFTANKVATVTGDIVTFTNTSTNSPTSYLWTITPSTFKYSGSTNNKSKNPQVSFSAAGLYTVKLTANNSGGNGVETKTNYISINNNATIENLNLNKPLAYPNPAKNNLTIEIPDLLNQNVKLLVFDMDGKNIENMQFQNEGNDIQLNTSKLANGRYNAVIIINQAVYFTPFNINK